jgi:uncharacterized membrane protein
MNVPYVLDWLNLIARWAHFVAGISWIGASFYFVWLDNHLKAPAKDDDARNGVAGELWSVHGGGFYHNQKFLTGPKSEPLTHDLHWFKWEAYTTWISGMAMLAIIYWAGAGTFLIDKSILDLTPAAAVAISIAVIVAGWIVYDALCRALEKRPVALWAALALFLLFADWGLFHVFGGRGASIHLGAIVGTIMVANVFFVIIPGQRRMLAQIRAGQEPDPRPGRLGKMRSVHNTYLTLPVLFIMVSNHYPMTYAGSWGWLVLAALSAAGVLVRRFFVLDHTGRRVWALPVAAAMLIVAVAIAIAPRPQTPAASAAPTAGAPSYATVAAILSQRCAVCHAANPTQPGFSAPPAGVLLDSPVDIKLNAQRIYAQAVASHAMPLGNLTQMTDAERATLGAWIDAGANY